ncbi:MAG: hypothetical protein ACI8W3_000024 [Myxococcota bacterium]|jgi:hypothetical protein
MAAGSHKRQDVMISTAADATRRNRWPLSLLAYVAAALLYAMPGQAAPNLVTNASFTSGLDRWTIKTPTANAGRVGAGGCNDLHCLQVSVPHPGAASVSQPVNGLEPGRTYRITAKVHAARGQRVRLALEDTNARTPTCAVAPKTLFVEDAGMDEWRELTTTVVIPVRPTCGSQSEPSWRIRVAIESRRGARPAVMIDAISVTRSPSKSAAKSARCTTFGDHDGSDPCEVDMSAGTRDPAISQFTTQSKWMLNEGSGRFVHDFVGAKNGLVAGDTASVRATWRNGVLVFKGGAAGAGVRVNAGQSIAGSAFEIAIDLRPADHFESGCVLASKPRGSALGGFRLCASQASQLLSFEISNGSTSREYVAALPAPLATKRWTQIVVRSHAGLLEIFVGNKRIKKFATPSLRLAKSPYELVIGADVKGVKNNEPGFAGAIRGVSLRAPGPQPSPSTPPPLGFVARGMWKLDEGEGIVVRDSVSDRHGVVEKTAKRKAPTWVGDRIVFAGTADSGGVLVQRAGPLYGDDIAIEFDAMLDEPQTDWGTLVATKTGSSKLGGFLLDYKGRGRELVVKLADGKRQVIANAKLPFALPAKEWLHFKLRLAHGQLDITIAGIPVGTFEFPDFALAESRSPMIVGAYYYPPSKGIKGSIRDVAFYMRGENIVETEGQRPSSDTGDDVACKAKAMRETLIVGSNALVPNWLGVSCLRREMRRQQYDFLIDLPQGFELEGSGASQVKKAKVVTNKVKKLGKHERDGVVYRRYHVELSYRLTGGHSAGFGPFFISSTDETLNSLPDGKTKATLPRMYFSWLGEPAEGEDIETARKFNSVALDTREFPVLPRAKRIHHSLAWMQLHSSTTWPKFFDNYKKIGFNVVPTLARYDEPLSLRVRKKFLKAARENGYEILAVDSPFHPMLSEEEARVLNADGLREPFLDPSYRGEYYRAELERIATRNKENRPDWLMMDIECFSDGAHACLIGTSSQCSDYLASHMHEDGAEISESVTDLGNELIADIRNEIAKQLGKGEMPRMGLNTSEPDQVYHQLFDFNKLYAGPLDYAQPILYWQKPAAMGARVRDMRERMPQGDIIAWVDPGTVQEYPTEWVYDRVLEVFGSGAMGIAWFAYNNFEGSDFYYVAKAMESVIPVEDLIVESSPSRPIETLEGGVTATAIRNGSHWLLLLSDYKSSPKERAVRLRLPAKVRGAVWDLARQRNLGDVSGTDLAIQWQPGARGARTALYYIGPASQVEGRFVMDLPTGRETGNTHAP